jgi:hypothetical protein
MILFRLARIVTGGGHLHTQVQDPRKPLQEMESARVRESRGLQSRLQWLSMVSGSNDLDATVWLTGVIREYL